MPSGDLTEVAPEQQAQPSDASPVVGRLLKMHHVVRSTRCQGSSGFWVDRKLLMHSGYQKTDICYGMLCRHPTLAILRVPMQLSARMYTGPGQ